MQAARGASQRLGQVFVGHFLEHEPDRAGVKRLLCEHRTLLHREHNDLHARDLLAKAPDRLDARAIGHTQIERQHARAVLAHMTHHRLEVARLRDHLEIILTFEQQPEAATHHRMVIGKHHANRPRRLLLPSGVRLIPRETQMPWHTPKLRPASTPRNRTNAPTLCGEIRSATGEGSEAGRGEFNGTEPGSPTRAAARRAADALMAGLKHHALEPLAHRRLAALEDLLRRLNSGPTD
jgi:hypothetical protein